MRQILLALLAVCTLDLCILDLGSACAQENPITKASPTRIDYSILAQPANAAKANLTDEQRAKIAEILDDRVNNLVASEPKDRAEIVRRSNAAIEALLGVEQKQALATSLQGGKLQFSFYKQKWSAVLKWFAEQADLSLVMDTEPPGLFTYNDTREFSPAEAIDLLNSVLLSKKFTLIRRERMLVVVDTSTGVPYDMVQQVPLEKLSDYGRFEIVTTEFPLAGRPVDVVVEAVTPLVGDHGQVIPLAAAGKLLVTETAGRLKAINIVIASVPLPKQPPKPKPPVKPPAAVFKTYPAPGLDAEATTDVLKLLFPAAAIRFDPNAQVIHCQAIPAVQVAVEASIVKLVESVTGDNRPRMKPYKVPAKQLASLVDQVTLAHPSLPIDSDPDMNRLLVVASEKEHTEVLKTLESLGAVSSVETIEGEATELVLYPVQPESIALVTTLLQEILPGATVISDLDRIAVRGTESEQETAKNTITPFIKDAASRPSLSFYPLEEPLSTEMLTALTGAVPEATISWLPEAKRLSVLATLKDHGRVTETLAQIKQAVAVPQEKAIAYYPVSPHQRSRFLLIQAELPGDLATMLLMTDASPDEFIAWGTEKQHKQLNELLVGLKKNEPSAVAAPQKLAVTVEAPADLVTSLQTRFPGVEMVFNEHSKELYVWAAGEKFESVRSAFQTITATMAPRQESVMIPYALKNADAEAVLALLIGMRPELNAAADSNANRILVSAPLDQQGRYKALIEQLDSEPNKPNKTIVESYPLKSIEPAVAITVLTPLFPELALNSDVANKRLVASGTTANHQRLAAAIEQIDVPKAEQDMRLESYDLGDANPTQIVSALSQLAPKAIASPNADGSKLFVWGDDAAHRIIRQAMEHLTTSDPDKSRSMKTYPLPKGAGPTAVSILQPVAADASLSLDATYENLIAFATEDEHKEIESAVDGLRTGLMDANDKTTSVYRLEKTTPTAAYTALITLLPDATLVADLPTSSLVAIATAKDHATIKSVIDQIENNPETARSLKTYGLPKGAGPSAVTTLQPIAPDASLSLDATYENLIAWATEEEHQALAAATEGLQQGLKKEIDKSTEVYRFKKSTPVVAYRTLMTLVPQATMAIDATAKILVATASQEDHVRIQEVVTQLESDSEASRSLKTYPLPRGAGPSAVTTLQPIALDASLSLDATYENLIAWATDEEHQALATATQGLQQGLKKVDNKSTEVYRFKKSTPLVAYQTLTTLIPQATMAFDATARVLVATASPGDHARIKEVVTQLESESEASRSMKAYSIPKSAAATALTVMQPVATEATLSIDATNENLIAFATEIEHKALADAIEGLRSDLVNANDKSTEVYRFLKSTPQAALTVLTTLIPEATLAVDEATSVLVATASQEQHEMIRSVVAQIEDNPESTRKMKAYPLPRGAAATAVTIMQPVAADASFSLDETQENLIVWATEAEHKVISEAVQSLREDLVNPNGDDQTVAVYPLDPELISAASLVESLDESTMDRLSVLPNVETNSLIVTGNSDAQAKFSKTIETITSQLKKTNEVQTEVYHFVLANPSVAVEALTSLYPDATFAVDEDTSVLVATATARQHQAIATVVKQIDTEEATGNQRTEVYRLHRASARTVYRAYQMLAPKATIGYDTGSNVIIATATDEDHKILKDATAQVEGRTSAGGTVKVYRLNQVRSELAASAIQSIVDSQSIEADIHANDQHNSLVVVADPDKQKVIEAAIRQLDSDDRLMVVFELLVNDPFDAERSVRDMYNDLPEGARPHIGVDFNNAKLFVRGSNAQVDQIRQMLTQMGEPLPNRGQPQQGNPNQRTIRIPGNRDQVIEQIKTVWPKLRKNRIQVITPSNRGIQPIVPSGDPRGTAPKPLVPDVDAQFRSDNNGTQLVVFQTTTRAAEPDDDDKADEQPNDAAPILMIADGDNITISSDDTEALDRLESLMKAVAGSGNRGMNHSNFAIFLLRNTSAPDAQDLLAELFEALPFHHGGGIHETVVVADSRLNALVVHGTRQAREMVGQLLEVLDSQGLPDPLNVYKSEILEFKHVHVSRAMSILKNVYKPQLSPGMGKKPIEIPEGVTSTVASVLTQINASNRGPILTLDMDQTTNSMIMRAPPELRDEIRKFAVQLDEKAADHSNRSVRVIQIKEGKSAIIQEALQQFIGNQPVSSGAAIVP